MLNRHLTHHDPAHRAKVLGIGAAAICALLGVALLGYAASGPGILRIIGSALVLAGVVESVAGFALSREGYRGMAPALGGILTVGFAVVTLGDDAKDAPAAAGLMFALYFFINGLFRGLDTAIDRPRGWAFEALYAVVALSLGGALFATWRQASVVVVAVMAGLELVARGVALFGVTRSRVTVATPDRAALFREQAQPGEETESGDYGYGGQFESSNNERAPFFRKPKD